MLYKKNALYTLIPKNGCSTMRLSIAIENGCIKSIEDGHWIHANNQTFNPSLSEAINADYTFVIMRCPYRRLASVYLDKFVSKEPDSWQYRDTLKRKIQLDDLTFRDFVKSLTVASTLHSNIHWRKQVDFLLYEEYTDYFCLENLTHAESILQEKISFEMHDARALTNHGTGQYEVIEDPTMPDTAAFDIAIAKREGKCPSYLSLYDNEIQSIADKIYRPDIEFFKNKFDPNFLLF